LAESFGHYLAHHAQVQVALLLAHIQVFVPELPVGGIVQRVRINPIMKTKERVHLAVFVRPFGFVNQECLLKAV
jgi:hypothetical protein